MISCPFSGRDHRGLDGDPRTGGRSTRSRQARSVSGGWWRPAILLRDAKRGARGGKKLGDAVAEGDRGAAVPRSDQAMRGGVAAVEDRTQGGYGVVMVGGLAQDLAPAARVRARPRTMHGKPGLSRRRQRESRDSRLRNHAGTPRSAPPGRRPLARAGRTYRLFELDDPSLPAPIIAPPWSKHRTAKTMR